MHGASSHQRHARGRGTASVRRFMAIIADQGDLRERYIERGSNDLSQGEMRSLSNVGSPNAQDHALNFGLTKYLNGCGGLLWKTKGVANIFDSTGNADTTAQMAGRVAVSNLLWHTIV